MMQSIFSKAKSKQVFNSHVFSIFTSISVHILAFSLANSNLTNILFSKSQKVHKRSESIQIVELESMEELETQLQPLKSLNVKDSSIHSNNSTISNTSSSNITKTSSTPLKKDFSKNENNTLIKDELKIKPNNVSVKNKLEKNHIKEIESLEKKLPDDKPINKNDKDNIDLKTQLVQSTNKPPSFEKHKISKVRQNQITQKLLEETLNGAEKLIYNDVGTQRAEARQKDIEWMQRTGIALKLNQMITIEGSYPKSACNLNLQGSSVYNILVNKNGKLNGSPFMTQSSGYGILNDQGLEDIKLYNFSQSTRVRVIFQPDYDKCPNLVPIQNSKKHSTFNKTIERSNNIEN